MDGVRCPLVWSFNPRLRTGGDEGHRGKIHQTSVVSIHASAREATNVAQKGVTKDVVSIHASAREATQYGA